MNPPSSRISRFSFFFHLGLVYDDILNIRFSVIASFHLAHESKCIISFHFISSFSKNVSKNSPKGGATVRT